MPGDYTGDGKTDVAFWRPSTGEWFILRSEDVSFYSFPFGANGDIPAPGDYDGDGKLMRPFSDRQARRGIFKDLPADLRQSDFGTNGDVPIPNAFVR